MQSSGSTARLILVCGLPGSGKTTHARRLEAGLAGVRLSPDEWMHALALDLYDEASRTRVEALQWRLGQDLLALGLTVILEWGTWGKGERDTLRLRARSLGAAVELHYLSAPVGVLLDRLQRRGAEDPAVDRSELERWIESFEAPTTNEMALFDVALTP